MKTRGGKVTRLSSQRTATEKEASEPEAMEGDALETEADALESEARNSVVGKKTRNRKRKKHIEEDSEEDREPVSGDDCEVVGDEDYDEMVREDELLALAIVPEQYCEPDGAEFDGVGMEDKDEGGIAVEEQNCYDFEAEFGADAVDDRDDNGEAESDADSGDDIWDDERIPDPLSYSDDEEEADVEEAAVAREDPEVILRLGKMFNGPDRRLGTERRRFTDRRLGTMVSMFKLSRIVN